MLASLIVGNGSRIMPETVSEVDMASLKSEA